MQITVITGNELSESHLARWKEILNTNPLLESPYFHPEFTRAVAEVRNDVHVAILSDGGEIVAFFPFQRSRMGFGTPVGGMLCDFHGVIALPGVTWEPEHLLRSCGLATWEFHHLLGSQEPFSPYGTRQDASYYLDLSQGYEAYAADLKGRGSKIIKDSQYNQRRLEREQGPVRFVTHTSDEAILKTLMAWKSNQYAETGLVDVFGFPWTRNLLTRILTTQQPDFRGMLSALYAGDSLIAIHMGMATRHSWNWWFPRHDTAFHKYSPGILLLLLAAEHAASVGIQRIDLGCGDEASYKGRTGSGTIPVASGAVEIGGIATTTRDLFRRIESGLRASPFYTIARIPGRWVTTAIRHLQFK